MFTLNIGLADAKHELLEKNLGAKGPVSTLEESASRPSSMKRSRKSPSPLCVDCCEATGFERRTVSIVAHCKASLNRL